ncbi:MAG: DUF3298 domain-containing protein [Gammaproteobacteria bacterium]|nr:DUF3298 domain-containing protein [Gammaproteobacteria bacterium]
MKKLIIFVATTFLSVNYTFAGPVQTPINLPNATVQSEPVDAVNIPDTEDADTNPVTNMDSFSDDESIFINTQLKAVPKTDHDENDELHYTIDATYPQIVGESLTPKELTFNKTVSNMVNKEINQFKNSVKMDAVHMNTLPEELRQNNFKLDYDIDVIKLDATTSILSVRLSMEGMQAGRAHPFHSHQVLNFDLSHGKELALKDLFKKNVNYLAAIAKYSNNKLNETLKDKWLIADGTKPNLENYKNWNIEADSLLITFDEYQVAPYVDGPQEVEIPLAELTKLIAADAPVMAEFKNLAKLPAAEELAVKDVNKKIALNKPMSKKVYTTSDLLN